MRGYSKTARNRGAAAIAAPRLRRLPVFAGLLAALALGLASLSLTAPDPLGSIETVSPPAGPVTGHQATIVAAGGVDGLGRPDRVAPIARADDRPAKAPAESGSPRLGSAADAADFDIDDLPESRIDEQGDAEAFAWLARRLEHVDPARREAAARVLGDIGGPTAVTLLAPLLGDGDRAVRLAAIDALAASGDTMAWTLLEPLLFDRDRPVRLRAIDALAALGEPGSVHALAALLGDGDTEVRRAAIAALDDIGGGLARDYLLPMGYDPDPAIRASVEHMQAEWRLAAER